MSPASALYEGWVTHRRHRAVQHEFRYRLFLPLLDLDELPEVLDPFPLWSARRPAPAWLRRADYLGDPDEPLDAAARRLVAERLGRRPTGPVRLLAQPALPRRRLQPGQLLFCLDAAGALDAVVAEVTNTPWGERHAYVLDARDGPRGRVEKRMHVSPFMRMDQRYDWWATTAGRGPAAAASGTSRTGRSCSRPRWRCDGAS